MVVSCANSSASTNYSALPTTLSVAIHWYNQLSLVISTQMLQLVCFSLLSPPRSSDLPAIMNDEEDQVRRNAQALSAQLQTKLLEFNQLPDASPEHFYPIVSDTVAFIHQHITAFQASIDRAFAPNSLLLYGPTGAGKVRTHAATPNTSAVPLVLH